MEKLDNKQVEKVSENVHELMSQLFENLQLFEKKSRRLRIRINKGLNELTVGLSNKERLDLQKMIVKNVQQGFDSGPNITRAARRISVGVSRGCVGNDGGGVTASNGSFTVKVCAIGSLDQGVTGGGVEAGWSY